MLARACRWPPLLWYDFAMMGVIFLTDWEAIKTEYITGQESHREIAKRYGVGASTLSARSSREGWCQLREQYRAGVVQKAVEKISCDNVDKLSGLMAAADDMCQLVSDFVRQQQGKSTCAKDIRDLAATLKDMTAVVRNLYGIPTQQERAAQEMAAQRLELEVKRAQSVDSGSVKIEIAGDVEDMSL